MMRGEVLQLRFELARGPALYLGMGLCAGTEGMGLPVIREDVRPLVCISLILFPCSLVLICPAVVPLLSRCCPILRTVVVPLAILRGLVFVVIIDTYDALALSRYVSRCCPDF